MPTGLVVIVAQQPLLTAMIAQPLALAPLVPLDIQVFFAMDVFQDITKVAQHASIALPSTLIVSPALIALTATLAKLDTVEPLVTAAHLITTEMVLPAPLVRP